MLHDPAQVYAPEADTFLLLRAALCEIRPSDRVLEIGTGSGIIAAGLPPTARTLATDINPHATACARAKGLEVIQSDLFSGIRGSFDLILFNPPYLPTQPEERIDDWLEYALDGGTTGRDAIVRFAAGVGSVLAPGGRILLLISSLTGLSEVSDIFGRSGYRVSIHTREPVEDEVLYVLLITRPS
ncbi:HemK2/MTQ2 family protein methyltransferase [uncultured Methanoregula sp.]|uniref:HemK2/MTQ2 family protein methyltransferase n=1 Tax=uncultured Methanoregula sp. TaxID=1005933 RepID=UPI002AAAEA15|nr:HemK2/MTQ2 family protein methyltransferase [uncultured Methanoregula sp.]